MWHLLQLTFLSVPPPLRKYPPFFQELKDGLISLILPREITVILEADNVLCVRKLLLLKAH